MFTGGLLSAWWETLSTAVDEACSTFLRKLSSEEPKDSIDSASRALFMINHEAWYNFSASEWLLKIIERFLAQLYFFWHVCFKPRTKKPWWTWPKVLTVKKQQLWWKTWWKRMLCNGTWLLCLKSISHDAYLRLLIVLRNKTLVAVWTLVIPGFFEVSRNLFFQKAKQNNKRRQHSNAEEDRQLGGLWVHLVVRLFAGSLRSQWLGDWEFCLKNDPFWFWLLENFER